MSFFLYIFINKSIPNLLDIIIVYRKIYEVSIIKINILFINLSEVLTYG